MKVDDDPDLDLAITRKRVASFVLNAVLFWNNQAAGFYGFIAENGLFYHHKPTSTRKGFFEFLVSIGVLWKYNSEHRLAIRPDAIAGYSAYLIDQRRPIDDFIDALVCIGGASWLETARTPFRAKFYLNADGTTSYDCRQLMADMVLLGYARRDGEYYQWTASMEPFLAANYY
jgi:hypothetical protein